MKMSSKTTVVALNILLISALCIIVGIAFKQNTNQEIKPTPQAQIRSFAHHPMMFVENQGQWDNHVLYMTRKQGMRAWLQKDGITFQFEKRKTQDHAQGVTMKMIFENASEYVSLAGEENQPTKHNFFIGEDRSQWRSGVPSYAQVIYRELYDDVDLRVRETAGWLEYDLLLSEGADLSDVVIRYEGLKDLEIDENGYLTMETEYGPIAQRPPTAWYEVSSNMNIPVTCNFRMIDDQRYGFEVDYDLGLALVIDPGLEWSTFLGGDDEDHCMSLDLTGAGHIIVAGATESGDFPATYGAYDTTFNAGNNDGFVSCLSADGSQLLWSTALGGSNTDVLFDVAVDGSGRVIVTGSTLSPDFPTTAAAYDTIYNGDWDGLVACLNEDGSQLLYSTYLGTPAQDMSVALDVSSAGDAVVSGYTGSEYFPTTSGAYDTTYNGGVRDAFVTRFSTDGSNLVYSTYLGGSSDDGFYYNYPIIENSDLMGVLLDNAENVIVSGMTMSSDFPTTPSAYDTTYNGDWDIFVAKLDETGSNLIFSTYLGGSLGDVSLNNAMCLREDGVIAVGGATWSQDFPTTYNAFDTTFNGGPGDWDAFVAVLDTTGSQLLYSTFMGGTGPYNGDVVSGMSYDTGGKILLAGQAESGFPVTPGAYDTIMGSRYDAFVARLSPDGNGQADLVYSSYIGGADTVEAAADLALIGDSIVVLVGWTLCSDFPTTASAYDTSYNGLRDGFVLRFGTYVGIQEQIIAQPQLSITLSPVYPNPARGRVDYEVCLTRAARVTVSLVDITGRLVETLIDRQLSASAHHFSWRPPKELANGVYFVKLQAGDNTATEKLLLIR